MATQEASKKNAAGSILPEADDSMIGGIRLLLAATALFAYLVQPAEPIRAPLLRMLALTGCLVYSLILLAASRSVLFLFFPFAIIVSAFRRTYGKGLRVTFASARDAAVVIGAIPV